MPTSHEFVDDPELLLAALLFLQTQFARQRRPAIAVAIDDHLRRLEILQNRLAPVIARAVPRLRTQWQTVLAEQLNDARDAVAAMSATVIPFPAWRVRG